MGVRLQILKTNRALIQQRIHAIESGAKIEIVALGTKPDPERAAQLEEEIRRQRTKVADARAKADQYVGGLVDALAETTVATAEQTLAMLEQQYLVAKYGLAFPSPASASADEVAKAPTQRDEGQPKKCLSIGDFDSSVLDANDVFTELAWKADIKNSCNRDFLVEVRFVVYDKDEFELDSDSVTIAVPPSGVGKARGKMLVSPPEKARRMARQGVQIEALR
ncbi:hypothetical protein HRbin09_01865 [bacterium HR09]|nr:hypothetical protein HRbin09_01865 [bacterium HR09]